MTTVGTRASCDRLIDAFVGRINLGPRDRLDPEAAPEPVRLDDPDGSGRLDWRIVRAGACPWAEAVEEALQARLPPSFQSFAGRYLYPAFQVGEVRLFSNTGHPGHLELSTVVLGPDPFGRALLAGGYLQIGRCGDRFDPVCLDLSKRRGGGEAPLVWIDHEADLKRGELAPTGAVAKSFLELISR